jgi:uncharacterized protein with PIN domain
MIDVGTRPALAGKPLPIDIPEESVTVINITSVQPTPKSRTYGQYQVPACVQGKQLLWDYELLAKAAQRDPAHSSLLTIEDALAINRDCEPGQEWAGVRIHAARMVRKYDKGMPDVEDIVHAKDIANDVCLECNSDLWGIGSTITGEIAGGRKVRGFVGIFSISGDAPTAEELAEARKQLRLCDKHFVTEGNKTFAKFGPAGIAAISDSFKVAAERTNQKPAWMFSMEDELPNCPHCGAQLLMPTATVCSKCQRDVVPVHAQERPQDGAKGSPGRKSGQRKTAAA